jgi:hypothetical protein
MAGELTEFADRVYTHDGTIRFFGFRLQRCMTVVRLAGDALFVHSPNRLDDGLRGALDALGEVRYVGAPNKMHSFAVDDFAAAYPTAMFCAAPGLPERRPGLAFQRVLGDRPEAEWADELDQAIVEGNAFFREVVFLHRATGTLIVTDLVENIRREHVSWWGWVVCRMVGVYGRPAASPEHAIYTLDADAAAASLDRILAWDFDRIVLAHGVRIERGGKAVFAQVAEDLVRRARGRGWLKRWFNRRMAAIQ